MGGARTPAIRLAARRVNRGELPVFPPPPVGGGGSALPFINFLNAFPCLLFRLNSPVFIYFFLVFSCIFSWLQNVGTTREKKVKIREIKKTGENYRNHIPRVLIFPLVFRFWSAIPLFFSASVDSFRWHKISMAKFTCQMADKNRGTELKQNKIKKETG